MAKIRVSQSFPGVRDGEHQARMFIAGACYELADDGNDPPGAVPGSLLAVALAEKWAVITAKGTPAEPELMVDASPQMQRLMAETRADDATLAAMEAAEDAAEKQRLADAAADAAEKQKAKDLEADATAAATKRAAEEAAKRAEAQKAAEAQKLAKEKARDASQAAGNVG